MRLARTSLTALAASLALAARADAPPPDADALGEDISVVAPTRLPRSRAGASPSVTTVTRAELRADAPRSVQEALENVVGVHLSDEQGNPFQQDLSMRGLVASPVTGLSQGLSVFVDGVRVNEPGVEEVNFDLLPLADVERVDVIRGPDVIFGRNTLGGAIQLVTRRGGPRPTAEVALEAGSWEHQEVQARAAGPVGALDGHLSVVEATERGWRAEEASRTVRVFGKLGLLRGDTDVDLSYQHTEGRVEQPGSLPRSMLLQDRSQNYTSGDFFEPALHLLTLNARQALGERLTLAANAYVRALDAEQFNAGWTAADTRMRNRTRTLGAALQLEHEGHWGPLRSHATAGAEATRSDIAVAVTEEPNARVVTADDGSALPRLAGDLSDAQVAVGAFAQEKVVLHEGPLAGLGATAALRFDRIAHDVVDTTPTSPGAATGTAAYARWTPALAASWASRRISASASWAEGFRAPAFLELTCADPQAPCIGLQAGVAPDATFTRLRPVRSRSFEVGVSATPVEGVTATVNGFRIDLADDIYSVPGASATEVYFQNVGSTRRQGVEASVRAERGPGSVEVGYAFTRATFESDVALATPRLPGGVEQVRPGDRLPLVPAHQLDVEARLRPRRWLELSAGVHWAGPARYRGDEANEAPMLRAYAVARAGVEARWRRWSAALRATNLLDARYETFGTFAVNGRGGGGIEPFLTPGAPLRVFMTVRWALD